MRAKEAGIVLRSLGLLLPTVALMAVLSLPVALAFGEGEVLAPLGWTAGVALGLGLVLYIPFRRAGEAQLKHGLIVAALGWLVVSALGALPLWLTSQGQAFPYREPVDAFFEAMSGFTGTGLTMAPNPEILPRTLQWWRTFMEWVGGMGVIVLMLTLLVGPGRSAVSLYFAEARAEKIHPSVASTVRTMWWIFALFTGLAIAVLWAVGMPLWDAINHAMTALATGGFSVRAESIGAYRSWALEVAVMVVMLAGATSFAVHYQFLRHGPRAFAEDLQTRWLWAAGLVGTGALGLVGVAARGWPSSFREGAFQWISALTCTGFQTTSLTGWANVPKLLMVVGMVLGGAAGSTAGGIKLLRFAFLVRGVSWQLKRFGQPPDALVPLRMGDEALPEAVAYRRIAEAAFLLFLWVSFLVLGTLILAILMPSASLADALFEVASAQGNVGLSVGITSQAMPLGAKLLLCFHMWMGRLEILPVLVLVRSLVRRPSWP